MNIVQSKFTGKIYEALLLARLPSNSTKNQPHPILVITDFGEPVDQAFFEILKEPEKENG